MARAAPAKETVLPRSVCDQCSRPSSVCLCEHLTTIETRTRVVILQHRRESYVPVGTARLAELVLNRAERHIGVEFEDDVEVQRALANPEAPAILLYPGPDARDLARDPPPGPVTLVVIDGTWWQAAKVLKRNPALQRLPRYALNPAEPSRYRIRREPAEHCVSTIEAIVAALAVLEGDASRVLPALQPFEALVEQQLRFAEERGARRHLQRARERGRSPRAWPWGERSAHLVVAYGEANAWPKGSPLGPQPEVVHWAAERLATGERFEAFVAPRHPLAPSFTHHTQLPPSAVQQGESWERFVERWEAFLEPNDLLCGWGVYSSDLLVREGARVPERLDLRQAALRALRRRPGDVEACAAALGVSVDEPWVTGRTGVRLAALTAVARALLERADDHSDG